MTRPFAGAARSIKNRLDAFAVSIVPWEDDESPDSLCIMAEFKGENRRLNYFAHVERFPLRQDWMERAISNLRRERERA